MGLSIPRIIFWIGIFVGLVALLLGSIQIAENVDGSLAYLIGTIAVVISFIENYYFDSKKSSE